MSTYFAMLAGASAAAGCGEGAPDFTRPPRVLEPVISDVLIALQERLTPEELIHSIEVANTAAAMAAVYPIDVHDAFLAGLLHDWDKCLAPEELLAKAQSHGVSAPPAAQRTPKLLHAYTAAAELAVRYPQLAPQIVEAVRCHTIGEPGMGDLAQAVYVADLIEPNRTHGGVDSLREMVGTVDLLTLFTEAFERTMAHLIADRKMIHPDTTDVWNWLVGGQARTGSR